MTATNHAITGSAIALAVKKPELAIPLAFISHFAIDLIPHYNPADITRKGFKSYALSWAKKMQRTNFRIIFIADMLLLLLSLTIIPLLAPVSVSAWTVFFSMLIAIAPDFVGGTSYLLKYFFRIELKNTWFDYFHVNLQWMERPWGMYIELAWLAAMLMVVRELIR